jgi:hypothetical protein
MDDVHTEPMTEPVRGGGGPAPATDGPTLVIRPRLFLRLLAPVLLAAGFAGLARGSPLAAVLLVPAVALALLWLVRVEADGRELRFTGLRRAVTVPIVDIDAVQLRRIPYGPHRPPTHTYRFGRFATTPIRLRVLRREEHVLELTIAWWQSWPVLVRYLLSVPGVTADSRTRGRLERFG